MTLYASPARRCRRIALGALVTGAVTLLAAGLLAPSAGAAVQSASLTMTSDSGDYVGQGQQYSYSTGAGDAFTSTNSAQVVSVSLSAANGDWWFLDLAAPAGQTLAAGTYASATRYPFQDPSSPGLDVFGNGRGCNTLTGSFTISQITFQLGGALDTLDADFEQHCEGAVPALHGRVHVVNAPAPPPLSIGIALDPTGTATRAGSATVSGTVTCNSPASVYVSGALTQKVTRFALASGHFSKQVACTGTTAWQATVGPETSVPFGPGAAQLSVDANAYDGEYQRTVTATKSASVRLRR